MNLQEYLQHHPPHLSLIEFLFKDEKPLIILDVGCCEGEDSLRYLNLFPTANVFAFEPYPPNIEKTMTLLGDKYSNRFRLFELALSDSDGFGSLHISSGHPPELPPSSDWNYGNKSSSLLSPTRLMSAIVPWLKFDNTLQVPTTTLDCFTNKHGIHKVDFIHIDVQGAELKVFQGGSKILPNTGVIWAEVADREIYEGQPTSDQLSTFLGNAGFKLVLRSVEDGFGDHLYINESYFSIAKSVS